MKQTWPERSAVLISAVVMSLLHTMPASAQPLDCEDSGTNPRAQIQCEYASSFGYNVGQVEGFANACGSPLERFFSDCASQWLAIVQDPGETTANTAKYLEEMYSYGFLHGQTGRNIPDEMTCDVITQIVSDSDIGRGCLIVMQNEDLELSYPNAR